MKAAVVVYPGTNCEHDVVWALGIAGAEAELVWHRETDLSEFDGIVLPGGFAHGDALRTGAIARFSPVMAEVKRLADDGIPVLGICNGFQVLCEAHMLPGALHQNRDLTFICRPIHIRVETTDSILTRAAEVGQVLNIPLNSYEGNFTVADPAAMNGKVLARYSDAAGNVSDTTNPNGSLANIAAISNGAGNVAGIMPHPERAVEEILRSADGLVMIRSFVESMEPARV
jgi:phosphoribosylformylglycinamidine synthase